MMRLHPFIGCLPDSDEYKLRNDDQDLEKGNLDQFKVCFICQGLRREHKSDAESLGLKIEEEKKRDPHEEELEDIKMLKKISADTRIITLPPLEA